MKAKFLHIPALILGMSLTLSGCLSDDTLTKSESGNSGGGYQEPIPNDGDIDQRVFTALNLEYPGLEAVRTAVEAQQWGKAGAELLKYYRYRAHVTNPSVNLLGVAASDTEKSYADYALKENDYRFYVKGFFEDNPANTRPYSFINAEKTGIDWTYAPTPEQELRYQLHRHQWMIPQAKTYKVTGDERYLISWIEVSDSWWVNNPQPASYQQGDPEVRGWRPLDVAARVMDQCDLFEYYKWGENFTAAYLSRFLARLATQVDFIKDNYWPDSNHRISQAQAVTIAGVLFPELENASMWVTNGSTVLNEEVVKQYYADGWLKDNDLSYHIASIESFRQAMLVATVNNQQSRFNADYVAAIRKMVEVEKYLIYPNYGSYNVKTDYNYSTPNFGDTRPVSWSRNVVLRHMRQFRDLFPDDQGLKWLASQGIDGQAPAAGIKCFHDGGHYAIRNGWTKDATMMILVNACVTPKEQWHRQWDNNGFELYVNGRQFFPDSGVFSYGGDSQTNADRNKYAATSAHSTLTLDGKNITSCRGVCLKAEEGTQTDLLVLENPSYAALTHRRAIFFVDHKFFVLVDEAYGSAAGKVNLHFQLLPGSDSEVVFDGASNGAYTAFADKNNLVVRTFSQESLSTTLRTGFLSVDSGLSVERKAYQVDQDKTAEQTAARFITVIYPAQDAASTKITASFSNAQFSAAGTTVKVSINGKAYTLSYTL